jgi:hypothetical protein
VVATLLILMEDLQKMSQPTSCIRMLQSCSTANFEDLEDL